MKKIALLLATSFFFLLNAQDYRIGHGYKIADAVNIGGYFAMDYEKGKNTDKARLDDVAFLVYGNLSSKLSYLVELEAAPFYVKDFENNFSKTDMTFHVERSYLNYIYSDSINFRIGKLITPIGYWNLTPINVLRDTSSNPLYSKKMFPKFVSGLDTNGYIGKDATLKYHVYLQVTDDLDKNYINIKNDFFTGASLEYEFSDEINVGGSLGYYETIKGPLPEEGQRNISLLQVNAKYNNYPFLVQTEWAYTDVENKTLNTNSYQFGGYLQGMYSFNFQHAIVGRYEYFNDTQEYIKEKEHIGIIGYSYRPLYSVSLKGEYQVHSDSDLNKFLCSFSVLF